MGLDMYLNKRTYVKNWEHMTPKERHNVTVTKGNRGKKTEIKPERVSYIIEAVGYWRKANQIHKWFVKNVQDGEDDCKEFEVSKAKLKELMETCQKVLKDHSLATELLPTGSGFFFGSTDYDEYYYNDLRDTVKQIKPLLKEKNGYFSYQSSW